MNEVKKILLAVLLGTCMFSNVEAQKIIGRSSPERPEWYGQTKENYLISVASGKSLEDAQRKSMDAIKIQMLESVAQNIEFSSETLINQFTHNQDVISDISFKQKGKNSVVNLPYITGVSLSKAKDSYWEVTQDYDGSSKVYSYCILYPFPLAEYERLKSEFDKIEEDMQSKVKLRIEQLPQIRDVRQLEDGISELHMVHEYYFDRQRKFNVENLIGQYKDVFNRINIKNKRIGKCKFKVWLTLGDEILKCDIVPKCKSETATRIKCGIDADGSYLVNFSDEDCIPDDENIITMTFKFKYYTLRHKLEF